MPVRRMVRNQIEDELETVFVRGADECIEIGHGAEQRIDAGIIRNVVTEIGHRGRKDRRQPDRVNSEALQIGQPADNPGDIADPVGIGILERARIDLVENAVPPPGFAALLHFGNHSFEIAPRGATLEPQAGSA
jgi:hypothetical protein